MERRARWVPWAMFVGQGIVTATVMGMLSVVVVFAFGYHPLDVVAVFNVFAMAGLLAAQTAIAAVTAVLLFILTGVVVAVLGLPVRLIPRWRRAWLRNGEWTIAGVLVGIALLIISITRGQPITTAVGGPAFAPEPWTLFAGWWILAFSLSLLVWPVRWMPASAKAWWMRTQVTA
ncbi:hypothetical protein [Homoserinibacter sp. GY 40078]|uniref:hypothetical protein n=1 Tax=Homoserinibacter sp. GY 40078 TaxID=2603275 RepID=UPI0011C6EA5A|nr:hypothetical protein [Homoserinibacter sp. GY 40078]TXK17153.1 hypothetical protein FVQ89_09815 [Homoserinibacter sp. GY 40078]